MRRLALLALLALAPLLVAQAPAEARDPGGFLPVRRASGPWAQRLDLERRRQISARLHRRLDRRHPKPPTAPGPAVCTPGVYEISKRGTPPALGDHQAALTINSSADDFAFAAAMTGPGALNTTNCPGVNSLAQLVASQPWTGSFMYTGTHTLVQANVYPSTARTPPATWTKWYPTKLNTDSSGYDQNPLFDTVGPGQSFRDAWAAGTGELVVWDTLDWLHATGGCPECDLSGYTIENATLRNSDGALPFVDAHGAVFRNVTFGAGFDFGGSNLRGAVFQNVTMTSPILTNVDLTGATFLGPNTITNPALSGSKLDGISLSAATSITGATVGRGGTACTTMGGSDLTAGRLSIASVTGCLTTPLFTGSQVRPSVVPVGRWTQVDWSGAVLIFEGSTRSYLAGASLKGLQMKNATFWGAQADLSHADLTGASLDGSSFTNADFTGAVLEGVSAVKTSFDGANLSQARLDQPQGMTTTLDQAHFVRATLDGATFNGSFIIKADFSYASALGPTDFGNTKADGVVFDYAHVLKNSQAFAGAVFDSEGVDAPDASFVGAVLGGDNGTSTGINFAGAHLRNAHFNGAQCIGCVFTAGAELDNANFAQSYLQGARFNGVPLTNANFGGAEFSDTTGTWTFALGLAETAKGAYSVAYVATDFTGSATTDVSTCPNQQPPDPVTGCLNRTTVSPPRPQPGCAAAGEDSCPTVVSTLVGTSSAGSAPNQVDEPQAVVTAPNGDVYFADAANHVVRRIVGGGKAVTIAGTGDEGDSGDGGNALDATLMAPTGLAIGADGTTLYVSDVDANRIRKITQTTDASGTTTYRVWAVAGSGEWCDPDAVPDCGDGPDPLAATFGGPAAIWVDPVGDVYVADTYDNRIRVVMAGAGVMTLDAGSLQSPAGITADKYGNVYVSDTDGARVRKITPNGQVSTVFGTGVAGYNGSYTLDPITHQPTQPKLGTAAQIDEPGGLTTNLAGQLFVAEAGNGLVRRLDTGGYIAIVAGKTTSGDKAPDTSFTADGQYANATGFLEPNAVAVTADGQYVVSDAGYTRVRGFGPYPR